MERIEQYTDYRKFLKDYYKERKKHFKYFSYRYFSKKADVKSPSLFKEVVQGKRNLTIDTIKAFIRGLGITENDGRFFTALVQFNQSEKPQEKQAYLEEMRGLKRQVKEKIIPIDLYAYFSNWRYPVLRELACLLDWKDDYHLLARSVRPAITFNEARDGIQLLLHLGFLEKTAEGRYVQKDPAITTGSEVISPAIREMNRQFAEIGMQAIQAFAPSRRDISSLTMGLSEKSYQMIKQEIQEFKNRVIRIASDDAASDKVYDLNVQLFPMSCDQPVKSEEK